MEDMEIMTDEEFDLFHESSSLLQKDYIDDDQIENVLKGETWISLIFCFYEIDHQVEKYCIKY